MKIAPDIRKRIKYPIASKPNASARVGGGVTLGCFESRVGRNGVRTSRCSPGESYARLLQGTLNAVFPEAAINVLD